MQPSKVVGGKAPAHAPVVGYAPPLYKEGDLAVDLYKLAKAHAAKPRLITSEGNAVADLPSRGKFELLAEMGSLQFEMVLPPVGGDWWRVYTSLFMKLAPRPSAGAKRARAQVAVELESLKARRVI